MLELNITGSLGDSMKESIEYSLKVALRLIPCELLNTIILTQNIVFLILLKLQIGSHFKSRPDSLFRDFGCEAGEAAFIYFSRFYSCVVVLIAK